MAAAKSFVTALPAICLSLQSLLSQHWPSTASLPQHLHAAWPVSRHRCTAFFLTSASVATCGSISSARYGASAGCIRTLHACKTRVAQHAAIGMAAGQVRQLDRDTHRTIQEVEGQPCARPPNLEPLLQALGMEDMLAAQHQARGFPQPAIRSP